MTEAFAIPAKLQARDRKGIEHQFWLLINQLFEDEDDWEDTRRGQLAGLLFCLGLDWDGARLVALSLWDARAKHRELVEEIIRESEVVVP
mgnify:FL=1